MMNLDPGLRTEGGLSRRCVMRVALLGTLAVTVLAAGAPAARAADAAEISVRAKLVEIPSTLPPDDLYDYAYVMRYEVIGGPLDKQSILVAHYKPRVPRSKIKDGAKLHVGGKLRSFAQGDVHRLKLSPDLKKLWKGALVDEFAATDRKSVRYWCLEADPD
jgi:hypothetical protein